MPWCRCRSHLCVAGDFTLGHTVRGREPLGTYLNAGVLRLLFIQQAAVASMLTAQVVAFAPEISVRIVGRVFTEVGWSHTEAAIFLNLPIIPLIVAAASSFAIRLILALQLMDGARHVLAKCLFGPSTLLRGEGAALQEFVVGTGDRGSCESLLSHTLLIGGASKCIRGWIRNAGRRCAAIVLPEIAAASESAITGDFAISF